MELEMSKVRVEVRRTMVVAKRENSGRWKHGAVECNKELKRAEDGVTQIAPSAAKVGGEVPKLRTVTNEN